MVTLYDYDECSNYTHCTRGIVNWLVAQNNRSLLCHVSPSRHGIILILFARNDGGERRPERRVFKRKCAF